jgi:hypothetical protein
MNALPRAKKTTITLFLVGASLLLSLALIPAPVLAQEPFDLNWTFDYSPLISVAPNSVEVRINNTGLTPIRLLSVGITFPWMNGTYLSSGIPKTMIDVPPAGGVQYRIPFQIPADVLTGKYVMDTLLQYEIFQTTQYGGPQSIVYALDVVVVGRTSSYSMTFDPYDGRFYSAVAVFILLGWYLPKRILHRAKG